MTRISDLCTFMSCNGCHIYRFTVTSILASISNSTPSLSMFYSTAVTGHRLKMVQCQWL